MSKLIAIVMLFWSASLLAQLPSYTPSNPSWNNEADPSGWTPTNATLSQLDSLTVRLEQTAHGSTPGLALQAITMPSNGGRDYALYVKVRCSDRSGDVQVISIRGVDVGNSKPRAHIYLNYNTVTGQAQVGTVSLRHTAANGVTRNTPGLAGVDLDDGFLELAMVYDYKFAKMDLRLRELDGSWRVLGQCAGSFFGAHIGVQVLQSTTAGAWIDWQYLSIYHPDIYSIGDSGTSGFPNFSPNHNEGRNNDDTSWQRYAGVYVSNRNNTIMNKGVGGQGSAAVAARVQSDVVDNGALVCFYSRGNNDYAAGVSQAVRQANIQSGVNVLVNAGVKVIELSQYNCTSTFSGNPGSRNYSMDGWDNYAITGVDLRIPYHVPIDAVGFQDAAYSHTDKVHRNVAGALLQGSYIAAQ